MKENVNNTKFEKAMIGIDAAVDTAIYCADYQAQTARLIDELRAKADRMEDCMIEEYGEDWRDDFSNETIAKRIEDEYGVNILSDEFGDFMLYNYSRVYANEMNEDGSLDEIFKRFIDKKEKEGAFSTKQFAMHIVKFSKDHTDMDGDEFYYEMRIEYVANDRELDSELTCSPEYCHWCWEYAVMNIETIMASKEYKKFASAYEV